MSSVAINHSLSLERVASCFPIPTNTAILWSFFWLSCYQKGTEKVTKLKSLVSGTARSRPAIPRLAEMSKVTGDKKKSSSGMYC